MVEKVFRTTRLELFLARFYERGVMAFRHFDGMVPKQQRTGKQEFHREGIAPAVRVAVVYFSEFVELLRRSEILIRPGLPKFPQRLDVAFRDVSQAFVESEGF